jgi:N2-acetyl-L-2,4-diaminobutanoate deacetylase
MRDNPITPTVDFARDGIQHGHLRLPYSRNDSAWGSVMIPLTVIRNGEGPVALFTGANHGDEYEGPLAITHLAQSLRAEEIAGTVILIPYMNYPAFLAGTRTSPLDGVNMNRAFPGAPDGTPTQKIADYFQRTLLPMASLVLDFHSGGRTLDFLPFAACHLLEDKALEDRCRAARDAFNAPFSIEMREIDALGMYDEAAESIGKTLVTTELGGGGTATPTTVAIARKGARNLLIHAGILDGTLQSAPTRTLTQPDDACFHFAPEPGLIEYCFTLGEEIRAGDTIAYIWPTGHTGHAPLPVLANRDGLFTARHHPGLVTAGDCLAVLAVETF